MKVGTKSLLFGVHQVIIHPVCVAIAWIKLFGFPKQFPIWISFIVHDWGYWRKKNMDGKGEGEEHPLKGANIMHRLFDKKNIINSDFMNVTEVTWYDFTLYHSRFYAKANNHEISKLCIADKAAFYVLPKWLYIAMASWSGEIYEYMDENMGRSGINHKSKSDWYDHVDKTMRGWVKDEIDKIVFTEATALVNKYKEHIGIPIDKSKDLDVIMKK